MLHKYNGILLTKKTKILSFAAIWMELEGIKLSEISRTKKYCMISHIRNLKVTINQIQRTSEWLQRWGSGRYKLVGVRQAQGCTAQHGEYRQYLVMT